MFERAVQLLALPILGKVAAYRHAIHIKLVQEATLIALHAHASQPVGAHSLLEVFLVVSWLLPDDLLRRNVDEVPPIVLTRCDLSGVRELRLKLECYAVIRHCVHTFCNDESP
ncbi:hypothetical protein V8C86DRAFT_2478325 [Haematococcus lacustris]